MKTYPDAIVYGPPCEYAAFPELWCIWLAMDINGEPSLQAGLSHQQAMGLADFLRISK